MELAYWFVYLLDAALLGFVAYGGLSGDRRRGFHRDAPEDAAQPHLHLTHEI